MQQLQPGNAAAATWLGSKHSWAVQQQQQGDAV